MNSATVTRLSIGEIVSNAISIGLKNAPALVLMIILYVLTIWVPYLNIGTTMGVWDQIVRMGRGESVSPTEIFDPKYRARIGDFFLLLAFLGAGTLAGGIVPWAGWIILLSWSVALPLFVDRNTGPLESLTLSNRLTYGNKLTIFLSLLVIVVGIVIVAGILFLILRNSPILFALVYFIIFLLVAPIVYSAFSYIYNRLVAGLEGEVPPVEPDV